MNQYNADIALSRQRLSRRLAKDYERLPETSEALIYAATTRLIVRRLARS